MPDKIKIFFFICCLLLINPINDVFGQSGSTWYAGGFNFGGGVSATISTPPWVLPYNSGQSNHITTAPTETNPYWIQAGWRFYGNFMTAPRSYVESYSPTNGYFIQEVGEQSWNSQVNYRVDALYGDYWCAYVNESPYYCTQMLFSSSPISAFSEVHTDMTQPLDTWFLNVARKTGDQNYYLSDTASWADQFPYRVMPYAPYYFWTYREPTWQSFIPLIIR